MVEENIIVETPAFIDSLPESIRGNEAFKGITDVGTLAQRLLDTMGKVPQVPEKYEFANDTPELAGLAEAFAVAAKDAGMTTQQAQKAWETSSGFYKSGLAARQAQFDANLASLKKEWGSEYDAKIAKAQRVMMTFGDNALMQEISTTGLGALPSFAKFLNQISLAMSEDTINKNQGTPPAEMKRTISGNPLLDFPNSPNMGK